VLAHQRQDLHSEVRDDFDGHGYCRRRFGLGVEPDQEVVEAGADAHGNGLRVPEHRAPAHTQAVERELGWRVEQVARRRERQDGHDVRLDVEVSEAPATTVFSVQDASSMTSRVLMRRERLRILYYQAVTPHYAHLSGFVSPSGDTDIIMKLSLSRVNTEGRV